MTTALSPTRRTTGTRESSRAVTERDRMLALLKDGLVGHLGVVVSTSPTSGEAGASHPVVLPVAYAVDPAGPDAEGTLYLHGSTGAGWLRSAMETDMCFTVTELDGLVAARSGMHHSMNYRSAVIIGRARSVVDPDELSHALDLIVDHMIPGRSATLRTATRKELAATAVLALPLREASMKERAGGPVDDPADIDPAVWAGVIPVRRVALAPVSADDAPGPVPPDVRRRAEALA